MPTILELFRGAGLDKQVKPDRLTGVEQELTGVRVKSAVELNNPLIYGNEATRIALRSTPSMDKMRTDEGDGGLIGGTIKKLRTVVNSTIGVPQTLIPSSYTKSAGGGAPGELKGLSKLANDAATKASDKFGRGGTLNDPTLGVQSGYEERLIKIKRGAQGSFIGGLLSGGTPKTIAQQAAGKLLKEAKDTLRDTLFNDSSLKNNLKSRFGKKEPYKEKETKLSPGIFENVKGATYSEKALENSLNIDEKSSTYIKYETPESQLAALRVGKGYIQVTGTDAQGKQVTKEPAEGVDPKTKPEEIKFKQDKKYTSTFDAKDLISAEDGKGFASGSDIINASGIYDGGTGTETDLSQFELDKKDFIPLYFRNIVTGETVHFRGTITGLSETVSPSWGSGKFSGNPFSYHTYESIERTVAFNFTIYPMNSFELANNWSKIEFLTSLTYPLGYQSGQIGSVRAPIIYFTMGDLYKDKVCFIDSLQYTIPDNSNWQLDGKTKAEGERETDGNYLDRVGSSKSDTSKGYKLPHLVEVATTLKFIEQRNNTEDRTKLYSFKSLTYGN